MRAVSPLPLLQLLRLYEIFWRQHQSFDTRPRGDRVDDFRHVGDGNVAVIEMIRLHRDARTDPTRVETARRARTRLDRGEPSFLERRLELFVHFDRSARCTRTLRGSVGAAIHADEEKPLAVSHNYFFAGAGFDPPLPVAAGAAGAEAAVAAPSFSFTASLARLTT